MCESTYVGCSNCGATVDQMSYWSDEQRREYMTLDESGQPYDYVDSGEPETYDSGYACSSCGSENTAVDDEREPDECECRECDPETAITEPEEDETIVLLRRFLHDSKPDLHDDTPPEVVKLFSDRAISVVPVRADRAAELYENDWLPRGHAEVDLTTVIPDSLQPEEAAA